MEQAGPDESHVDVAVVGGGVAGTYVASRLTDQRPDWRLALFESAGRTGGRLLSLRLPELKERVAELDAMRFRTSQPLVTALVAELGLRTRPFLTVHEGNHFFLRGSRWCAGAPDDAAAAYHLAEDERGLSPGQLLVEAFDRVVPGAIALDDDDWADVKKEYRFRGRLLHDWSMRDVLAGVLSPEGHRYVVDGFGYSTLLEERNAADGIPWVLIETRPESENRTLVDGLEQIPRELARRFVASGGKVYLEYELVAFEHDGDSFRLRFKGQPDVLARRVILALPRCALELVSQGAPLLASAETRSLISSVAAHPAAKLFLAYANAWWREHGFDGLRAVCDLPLSKLYYFDESDASTRRDQAALLLASYSDGDHAAAWRAMSARKRMPPDSAPFDSDFRWRAYAATEDQVREAQRQLRALHRTTEIPDPIASAFIDWGSVPFAGAWHVWNVGVRSWEVMPRITQPAPSERLYICGEAYSWSQGWVEGALESAERVLARIT